MNEPYRLRYTNQIVGAFLLVILLFLLILSVLFFRAGDYLVKPNEYWFEVSQEEISGLHKGAEVMILGESAGSIHSIDYVADTDKVRVNLRINSDLDHHFFDDTVVRMERKFGVGTPILIIRRSKPTGLPPARLPSGGQLTRFESESDRVDNISHEIESVSQSVRQIQEQLDPTLADISDAATSLTGTLSNNADPALLQTRAASESLYNTSEAVRPETLKTLETFRTATTNLETRVETLTDKIDRLVDNDMRDTLNNVSSAANTVNRTSDEVNQDIAATLETLREAAAQVQQLALETRDLVKVVREEANDLPGTTARFNDTVSETQDMVGEIRNHWLLRRSAGQRETTSQLQPSSIRVGSPR